MRRCVSATVTRSEARENTRYKPTKDEMKPLLKYSSDEYTSSPKGVRAVWGKVQSAGEVVTKSWARAVRFVHFREVFAEFLATFALLTFGNGAVAQAVLSRDRGVEYITNGTSVVNPPLGTEMSINLGYAVGVMIGAYVAIGVSGAHMNPAVTLAMALRGKTCWLKVIPYSIAQFLGAFFSSAVVYGTYIDALNSFELCDTYSTPCTAGIFATYPQPYLTLGRGFLDQVVGTFLLLLGVFAITDPYNAEMEKGVQPVAIGFLLWGIGASFGFNCGYAINPARDLGPRVFTAIAGWGKDVFV
jgi:MIP family channel proteins